MRILINDEIGTWGITAKDVVDQLSQANGDITVEINSPGGSVFEGITIFNALHAYDKGTVTVEITGLAASIASYIALVGDVVKAYDNATYMIHNAWTFAYGDANELRKTADILEGLSNIIAKRYVSKTGKTADEVKQLMDQETYLYGDEILNEGFCDEIISTNQEITKKEAVALSQENFKASCLKAKDNFNHDDFEQAVAKVVKDGVLDVKVEKKKKVVDNTKQKQRARELDILQRELKL